MSISRRLEVPNCIRFTFFVDFSLIIGFNAKCKPFILNCFSIILLNLALWVHTIRNLQLPRIAHTNYASELAIWARPGSQIYSTNYLTWACPRSIDDYKTNQSLTSASNRYDKFNQWWLCRDSTVASLHLTVSD